MPRGRWRRSPSLLWGCGLIVLLAVTALAAPLLAPYPPDEQLDPAAGSYRPPGPERAGAPGNAGSWRLPARARRPPAGLKIEPRGAAETIPASEVLNLA